MWWMFGNDQAFQFSDGNKLCLLSVWSEWELPESEERGKRGKRQIKIRILQKFTPDSMKMEMNK